MKVIVPMAGMGKRMRPHTLTVPKPLLPVAGKPIVHWLIEDIARVCRDRIEEVAFVIGDFGAETEQKLLEVAESRYSIRMNLWALHTRCFVPKSAWTAK
jgi:glucose-1-phosphate thymidylyltransferase